MDLTSSTIETEHEPISSQLIEVLEKIQQLAAIPKPAQQHINSELKFLLKLFEALTENIDKERLLHQQILERKRIKNQILTEMIQKFKAEQASIQQNKLERNNTPPEKGDSSSIDKLLDKCLVF